MVGNFFIVAEGKKNRRKFENKENQRNGKWGFEVLKYLVRCGGGGGFLSCCCGFFGILSFRACSSSFVGQDRGREPVRAPSFVCRGFISLLEFERGFPSARACPCCFLFVAMFLAALTMVQTIPSCFYS